MTISTELERLVPISLVEQLLAEALAKGGGYAEVLVEHLQLEAKVLEGRDDGLDGAELVARIQNPALGVASIFTWLRAAFQICSVELHCCSCRPM